MARSWTDAKAKIAAKLAEVQITAPIAQKIKRVYVDAPPDIQDVPCFVIYPPAVVANERPSGSLRRQQYLARLRLFVLDADIGRAAALVDAFRSVMLGEGTTPGVFDATYQGVAGGVTLAQTCVGIEGPTAEEAASIKYPAVGGPVFTTIDFLLTLHFEEAIVFEA